MQEDTHYHNYHFTVESGYTTALSNICRQNIDGDQDSIFHCPQDEHSSENRFCYVPILGPSQLPARSYASKLSVVDSQYPTSSEFDQETGYIQSFAIRSETMLEEELPDKVFSATLDRGELKDNYNNNNVLSKVFQTIDYVLQHVNNLPLSYQREEYKNCILLLIDMLTLVMFVVFLKRWLQFDVFGRSSGGASDMFLDSGGFVGASRCRRRRRSHQTPRINWVFPDYSSNEESNASCSPPDSPLSRNSRPQRENNGSDTSDSDDSCLFDDENKFEGDTIEISISSDEISSLITSSSFSLTESEAETEDNINEKDGNYSSISSNVNVRAKIAFANNSPGRTQVIALSEINSNRVDSQNITNLRLNSYCNSNNQLAFNEEPLILDNIDSIHEDNEDDDTSSEFSWFNEHYPDWFENQSSQQFSRSVLPIRVKQTLADPFEY